MRKKAALILSALIAASTFAGVSASATEIQKTEEVTQKSATATSVTLKWKKTSDAKYDIKLSNGKNAKRSYKNIKTNKYTIPKLHAGKTYYIKVRAKKGKLKGAWSEVYTVYTAPKITYKWENGKLTASWTKMKKATSYNVKLELNFNKKNNYKVKNLKDTSYTFTKKKLKGLRVNKVYNILVRPYIDKQPLFTSKVKTRDIEVVGHRGRMDIAPENTLASFKEAHKSNYDSVEADYFETYSGEILISHDRILTACGSKADIRTLTLNTIKQYPIVKGTNVDKYSTQYLPTVDEVIRDISKYKMRLYLHTKDPNTSDNGFKKIAAAIKKYKMEGKVTVFSPSKPTFERIKKNKLQAGFLLLPANSQQVKDAITYAGSKNAYMVIFKYGDYINADLVSYAHSKKLRFGCYNINSTSTASTFTNMKPDFLITNYDYFS